MAEKTDKKRVQVGRTSLRKVENPQPVEKASKGIIRWGNDNLYPHDLVSYRQDNPIHGGIIEQKVTFMSSAGVDILGLDQEEASNLETILIDAIDDFETFNGFAILFKRNGEKWLPNQVDFESVRFMEKENWFAISDDWSAKTQSAEKTNYKEVKDVSKVMLTGDQRDNEVLLYARVKPKQRKLKNGKLSLCYYPVPNYIGAMVSILAGIEQDYFTYSESVNGYKGGTIISLNNGQPDTDEEADEIADKLKKEATDRDTQGGVGVLFSDGADNAATVLQLNGNDLDKRYLESNKEIRSKIMVGHQVGSPTLFAVNSDTMFGSKEEMETAYELFSNNYVLKRQNFVKERVEWAFSRLGMKGVSIAFRKYILSLTQEGEQDSRTLRQLNSMSPLVASKVLDSMTEEEIRQLVRLTGVAKEGMSSALKRAILMNALSKSGKKREDLQILKTRTFDLSSSDEDFLSTLEQFDTLTKQQQLILRLIADGKSFSEVSKALGKGALALSLEIVRLNAMGVLKGWNVPKPNAIDLEVRYSYEVKQGLGPAIIEGTRDFCRDLIALDRLYTRAEIDRLSNELGEDVWRYRGGWYTNPKTGKTTPSCRHEWKQNIVRS
jgi:hypothetical protein